MSKNVMLNIRSGPDGTGLVLEAIFETRNQISIIPGVSVSEVVVSTVDRRGNADLVALKVLGGALEDLRQQLGLGHDHVYWHYQSKGVHVPLEGARSRHYSSALAFDPDNTFVRRAPDRPGVFGVGIDFTDRPRVLVLWPGEDELTFKPESLEELRTTIEATDADMTVVHDWNAMCEKLADPDDRPHVLHMACHGEPGKIADPVTNREIPTSEVADAFGRQGVFVPHVVVCTVCYSSDPEPSEDDAAGRPSLADALLEAGVDAVVSWTGEAHMDEAVEFAADFWSAVLNGAPLDQATLAGRCAQRELAYRQQWATVSLSTTQPGQPIFIAKHFEVWRKRPDLAKELDAAATSLRHAIRALDYDDQNPDARDRPGSSGPLGLGLFVRNERLMGVDVRGDIHDLTDIDSDELLDDRGDVGVNRARPPLVEVSTGGEAAAASILGRISLWTDLDADRPRIHDGPFLEPGSRLLAIHRRTDDGYAAVVARPSDASGSDERSGATVLLRWSTGRPDDRSCSVLVEWSAISACVDGTRYLLVDSAGRLVAVDWRGDPLALPEGLTEQVALLHATAERGMLGRRFRMVTEKQAGGWSVYGPDGLVTRVAEDPRPEGAWLVPDVAFGRSPVVVIARQGRPVELRPVGIHDGA